MEEYEKADMIEYLASTYRNANISQSNISFVTASTLCYFSPTTSSTTPFFFKNAIEWKMKRINQVVFKTKNRFYFDFDRYLNF